MTITIGRASLDTAPNNIVHDGDGLRFNLDLNPGTLDEARALRQQLTGLVAGEVIPVTFSLDPDFDGFYEVSAPVAVSPITTYLSSGFMRSVVSLRRIGGGYGSALVEIAGSARDLMDDDAAPHSQAWLPTTTSSQVSTNLKQRTTEDGTIYALLAPYVTTYPLTFESDPGDYYESACVVEQKIDGAWYPVVGDQIPLNADVRLGNGLVRYSWSDVDTMVFEVYSGGTWDTVDTIQFGHPGAAYFSFTRVRVVRNDPESVVVKFTGADTTNGYFGSVALSLRRGAASAYVANHGSVNTFVIATTAHDATEVTATPDGGSATDIGYRASSATADGHKWLLFQFDSQFSAGNIQINPGGTGGFIGVHRDAAASPPDDEASVVDEARNMISMRQRIIT